MYEECLGDVRAVLEELPDLHSPAIPHYSDVARHEKYIEEFTADCLWENLRHPVHFHQTISSILEDHPDAVFIEISPTLPSLLMPPPLASCRERWCVRLVDCRGL